MEKPRIAVYHYHSWGAHNYLFYAVEGKPPELPGYELVSTRRPPQRFASAVKSVLTRAILEKMRRGEPFTGEGEPLIGEITCHVMEAPSGRLRAITNFYAPKSGPAKRGFSAPGLGAYLELVTVKHLEKQGIEFLSSTKSPSPERIAQLRKAGLYKGSVPVRASIAEWLKGLGRVLKCRYP